MRIDGLNLIEPIQKALKSEGYTKLTPIQEKAIPHLLEEQTKGEDVHQPPTRPPPPPIPEKPPPNDPLLHLPPPEED